MTKENETTKDPSFSLKGWDIELLKEQKDAISRKVKGEKDRDEKDLLTGVLFLYEGMIDIAEGYPTRYLASTWYHYPPINDTHNPNNARPKDNKWTR